MTNPTLGRVREIWRFPVKSLGGEAISETRLDGTGIAGDRRIALRDTGTGKILSAKTPKVGTPLLECAARTTPDGGVEITVAGTTIALTERAAAESALSAHLGRATEIVTTVADDAVYESYWPEIEGVVLSDVSADFPVAMATEKASFVDLAALHLVTTASLAELTRLAPASRVGVGRFRPSFVIDTPETSGFVENDWAERRARIGEAEITFGTSSPRCVMTTLAQPGFERDLEVLRTLARHNRIEMPGFGHFACFGVYAEVTRPGSVRVGDELVPV